MILVRVTQATFTKISGGVLSRENESPKFSFFGRNVYLSHYIKLNTGKIKSTDKRILFNLKLENLCKIY